MANQVAKIKLTNQLAKNHLTALEKNHLALTEGRFSLGKGDVSVVKADKVTYFFDTYFFDSNTAAVLWLSLLLVGVVLSANKNSHAALYPHGCLIVCLQCLLDHEAHQLAGDDDFLDDGSSVEVFLHILVLLGCCDDLVLGSIL